MSKIVLSDLRVPKFGPKYSKWVYGGPRECDGVQGGPGGVQGCTKEFKGIQVGLRGLLESKRIQWGYKRSTWCLMGSMGDQGVYKGIQWDHKCPIGSKYAQLAMAQTNS